MQETYEIFVRDDNRALCPICKGMLTNSTPMPEYLRCHDCGNGFIHTGDTDKSEHIMQYRRVPYRPQNTFRQQDRRAAHG